MSPRLKNAILVFAMAISLNFCLWAQTPPAPGTGSAFGFVTSGVGTAPDSFTAILADAVLTPLGPIPFPAIPLFGKVPTTAQRRAQLAPEETMFYWNAGSGLIALIPTVIGTTPSLEWIDFRAPTLQRGSIALTGVTSGTLDILGNPATGAVYVSSLNAAGNVVIDCFLIGTAAAPISLAGQTAPNSTVTLIGPPSPFVTSMSLDAATGNIVVPLNQNIEVLTPNPVARAFAPYPVIGLVQICTNVNTNFNGVTGQNCIVATTPLSATAGGGGWMSFSAATRVGNLAGANAFAPFRPSFGFNNIAVTTNYNADSIATFLLQTPGQTTGTGAVSFAIHPSTAPLFTYTGPTSVITQGTPFGDPEPTRTVTGVNNDAVAFMISGQFVDSIGVTGTLRNFTLGAVNLAPVTGFFNVSECDRPYNIPGSRDFVVTTGAAGASSMQVFTVAAPTIPMSAAVISANPATFMVSGPSTLPGWASSVGALPAVGGVLAGFGNTTNALNHFGAISPATVFPLASAVTLSAALPIPAPAPGTLLNVPAIGGTGVGAFTARRPAFTYDTSSLLQIAVPETTSTGSQVTVYFLGVPFVFSFATALSSEIVPF